MPVARAKWTPEAPVCSCSSSSADKKADIYSGVIISVFWLSTTGISNCRWGVGMKFFLRQNSRSVWSVQEHAWRFADADTQAIHFVTCQYPKWSFHRASSRQKQEQYSCYIGIYLHSCWPCPRWSPYKEPTVDSGCTPVFWGAHMWYLFRSAPLWFGSHERESLRPYTDVRPFLPLACLPSDGRHNRHVLFPLFFWSFSTKYPLPDSPSIASGDLPL